MKKTKKIISLALTALASFNILSPVMALDKYEEGNWGVRKINLTPKGRIKITLCRAWGTPSGYIDIGGKPYYVSDANKITKKKIIWNTSDKFEKNKSYDVKSSNLLATQRRSTDNRKFVVPINIGCKGIFTTAASGSSVIAGSAGTAGSSVIAGSAATAGSSVIAGSAATAGTAATIISAGSIGAAAVAPVVVTAGAGAAAIIGGALAVGIGVAAGSSGSGGSSSN